MNFKYIECVNDNPLINNFYELNVGNSSIPLHSKVIPTAQCHIIFLKSSTPIEIVLKNNTYKNIGLVVLGQSYKSYQLNAKAAYYNFGINFHPTGLYKLLKRDISKLTDKHEKLSEVSLDLFNLLNPLFEEQLDCNILAKKIEKQLLNIEIFENKNTELVDEAIKLIYNKEGKINVDELLKSIPISQKHLEVQFKKIVGLTPLKFIKLYKFLNLMKKYESKKASISQLIEYYGYYDLSHFTKDFMLFMNQKPTEYFKSDNEFLNNYLKR
ncbi:helix-turn-helix domain-containing protein [Olleya sp. YS]|uniref:helix-turn-helix domain-containing protein n=1 Tax=Olleya sp. YS TaxID=3028318 RepID=UPI002434117A|nr:helix-turn-helix domain-containing protein [Olleya sp. YS]WGD34981.1 helix-turn-helix domain-containing protein [Olleya sp. YS]